jgi:hypothetical protein
LWALSDIRHQDSEDVALATFSTESLAEIRAAISNVRFILSAQPVDATLHPQKKMDRKAKHRGYFRGFVAAEKTKLWDRWECEQLPKAIGRAFGVI